MFRQRYTKPVFIVLLFASLHTSAQLRTVSPEHADSLIRSQPRPMLFFIIADWCRYCYRMEQTTFKDPKLAAFINRHFYFIRMEAGENRPIRLLNRNFHYQPTGPGTGAHTLIRFLLGENQISYPALILLTPEGTVLFRLNTFITASDLQKLLTAISKQTGT